MKKKVIYYFYLLCICLYTQISYGQISPGELSNAHQHLDGLDNCTQCHVLNKKETTSKCLACHVEINNLIKEKKGYHASSEVNNVKCAKCHGEHFGENFEVIHFDKEKFNHELAGYKLQGKHAELDCNKCHKEELIINQISQKKQGTYLGLGKECTSCHQDYHQNTLSSSCISCHDQNNFRPAPGFNHSDSNYPLLGKHQEVDCVKCHKISTKNGKEYQQFVGVKFSNCTSCHTDIHNNKFGNDCRKCHDEYSFTNVRGLENFNHDLTDFALKGKHVAVDCRACHKTSLTQPLEHNKCNNCHSDYHRNQFVKNGIKPDCAQCHSVSGFSGSSYTLEDHNKSDFPLEGAHMATPCFSCHKKTDQWNFYFRNNSCTECHSNIHKNYLPVKYLSSGNCKNCHSTNEWNDINFDHNQTKYALQGKHLEVECKKCHFSYSDEKLVQKFTAINTSCENCHKDIHYGQFNKNGKNDCERCHVFSNWNPEKFNHDDARFALDGKHVNVECIACHRQTNYISNNYIIYKINDISCASCH